MFENLYYKPRGNKKKFPIGSVIFYSLYFLIFSAIAALIVVTASKLNSFLDEYERALPKYKAEEIFNDYYSSGRFDLLFDLDNIKLSEFENKSFFESYMKNTIKDKKITYREVSAGLGDEKKYVVAADNVKFSEFMLQKTNSPSSPEDTWELCSVRSFYHQAEKISLKILKSSKLYLNGVLVSDDYIIKDSITTDSCKHMPDGIEGIMYREYEIDGLLLKPDFKVIDRYGNESSVVYDENNFYFAEQLEYDKYTESIKELTQNAVQTYARYMTLDTSLANVKKYFDADSQIFTYIKTSDTWCYTPHIGYDFKNIEFSEYYKYDENTFSTRYKCDHFVYRAGFDPYLFPLDLTLYFKNINGTFFVYDMVSNY